MSEDYTYDAPVTDWRKRAEAAERERDELRARLDAVPVEAMKIVLWGDSASPWYGDMARDMGNWLLKQEAQPIPTPDEPDAPLTLAAIDDEDGDL